MTAIISLSDGDPRGSRYPILEVSDPQQITYSVLTRNLKYRALAPSGEGIADFGSNLRLGFGRELDADRMYLVEYMYGAQHLFLSAFCT